MSQDFDTDLYEPAVDDYGNQYLARKGDRHGTGQWYEIGTRIDRVAYLRQTWPLLVEAIEDEARASLEEALRICEEGHFA